MWGKEDGWEAEGKEGTLTLTMAEFGWNKRKKTRWFRVMKLEMFRGMNMNTVASTDVCVWVWPKGLRLWLTSAQSQQTRMDYDNAVAIRVQSSSWENHWRQQLKNLTYITCAWSVFSETEQLWTPDSKLKNTGWHTFHNITKKLTNNNHTFMSYWRRSFLSRSAGKQEGALFPSCSGNFYWPNSPRTTKHSSAVSFPQS